MAENMWVKNLILRAYQKLGRIGEEVLIGADKQRKRCVGVIKGERGQKLHHSRKNLGFRVRVTTLCISTLLLSSEVILEK